jgi:hypothetical protein
MLLAGWGRIGIEVGEADNTFKLATEQEWEGVTGQYFVGGRISRYVIRYDFLAPYCIRRRVKLGECVLATC